MQVLHTQGSDWDTWFQSFQGDAGNHNVNNAQARGTERYGEMRLKREKKKNMELKTTTITTGPEVCCRMVPSDR